MKLFVGLDVSLSKTSVCVISEPGKIIKEAETESEPEVLTRLLAALFVELLEPVEAVPAVFHHLAGLRNAAELLGKLQQPPASV